MLYVDRKYLLMVSSRLRNFAQKDTDVFNFSCPFCGDSTKNTRKARGYIYARDTGYFYCCHNCSQSTNFYNFLKYVDSGKHREYVFEKFANKNNHSNQVASTVTNVIEQVTVPLTDELMLGLYTVELLPEEHYAKQYIRGRMIPEQFWNEIYYTDKYRTFMDDFFPGHGKENLPNDSRVVMPYTNFRGEFTNIAGRALESGDTTIRYVTVKIKDEKKGYGLHRLSKDKNERVYITEGQFDSLFLPNAVASGDSNLLGMAGYLKEFGFTDVVLVYDKECRNRELVRQIELAIQRNQNVVLFPEYIPGKDLNEMILNGMDAKTLLSLVTKYTYGDLVARLEFNKWKKC